MAHELAVNDVYIRIRLLPDECCPGHVTRDDGVTMIYLDPRASKVELVMWCSENLFNEEANLMRRAYGLGPRGAGQLPDAQLDGRCEETIPMELRLPGIDYGTPESVEARWEALHKQLTDASV